MRSSRRASPAVSYRPQPGAFALAAVLISAFVGQIVHVSLVPHTLCAEHGEPVHGKQHLRPALWRASVDGQSKIARVPEAEAAEEHEHCAVDAGRRPSHAPRLAWTFVTSEVQTPLLTPAPVPLPRSGEAIYRRAPKSSPPA